MKANRYTKADRERNEEKKKAVYCLFPYSLTLTRLQFQ